MSIEKLEKQVTQLKARLAEIPSEQSALERAPEREQERLDQARAEVQKLTADIKGGAKGDHGTELAEVLREVARLENSVSELERTTAPKLRALEKERESLQTELAKIEHKIAKDKFHAAVAEYAQILKRAVPLSNEIRKLAIAAGITLEQPNMLLTFDEDACTLGGYNIFESRPW